MCLQCIILRITNPCPNSCASQGTNDQSRYLSVEAAFRFVEEQLGGWAPMRAYNTALARSIAGMLVDKWQTRYMLPPELSAPFTVAVELPLDYRRFVRVPVRGPDGSPTSEQMDATGLSDAEAEAAAAVDADINERVATMIFRASAVQTMCFLWKFEGRLRLWCRVSAQVYSTMEDYERLADAVLDLAARSR